LFFLVVVFVLSIASGVPALMRRLRFSAISLMEKDYLPFDSVTWFYLTHYGM